MRTVVIETQVENLEGVVELRLPTFDEKYEFFDSLDINLDSVAEASEQLEKQSAKQNLKMMRKMIAVSLPHYVKVDIKNSLTNEEFKSVDDLQYGDGHNVLIEMASKLIHGTNLGNGKKLP